MKQFSFQSLFLTLSFLFATYAAQAQFWTWARQAAGMAGSPVHYGMATDATGNYYVCGTKSDNSGGPCYGGFWLGKYTPSGTMVYEAAQSLSTPQCLDHGNDVAVNVSRNEVYVCGRSGSLPALLTFDATSGTYLSQITFNGPGTGDIKNIDFRLGALFAIGNFTGNISISTSAGTTTLSGGGIFILKFNVNTGALVASRRIYAAVPGALLGFDIKTGATNNIYLSLSTQSNVTVQGSGSYTASGSGFDAVLMALNANLGYLWAKTAENYTYNWAGDEEMPVCYSQNNLYIGMTRGNGESRIKRYNLAGTLLSTVTLDHRLIRDLTGTTCGKIYATGKTSGVVSLPCTSYPTNLFISRHNASSLVQEKVEQSSNACAVGEGIVTDPQGNPIVCGAFWQLSTLQLGSITLSSNSHAFVAHYTDDTPCCATGNNAIDFDGTNDYIQAAAAPLTGNVNFTVEAWFRTTASNSLFRRLIGWGGTSTRFEIGVTSGKLSYFHSPGMGGSQAILSNVVNDNQWHHVAATRSGTTLTLYLDGVQVMTKTLSGALTMGMPFRVGRWPGGYAAAQQDWMGQVDEVRVWNSARSLADINSSRYCAIPGNTAGLVLYYNFQNGTPGGANGNTAPNIATPANTATFYNFAQTGNTSNWICSSLSIVACLVGPNNPEDRADELAEEELSNGHAQPSTLFPNPASQEVTIRLAKPAVAPVVVTLYGLTGQALRQQTLPEGEQDIRFDLNDLPPSLYLVEIKHASGQKEVLKVMKQ